jgi:hypothetical protein
MPARARAWADPPRRRRGSRRGSACRGTAQRARGKRRLRAPFRRMRAPWGSAPPACASARAVRRGSARSVRCVRCVQKRAQQPRCERSRNCRVAAHQRPAASAQVLPERRALGRNLRGLRACSARTTPRQRRVRTQRRLRGQRTVRVFRMRRLARSCARRGRHARHGAEHVAAGATRHLVAPGARSRRRSGRGARRRLPACNHHASV